MSSGKYSDDPDCMNCRHKLVVHRGVSHGGPCAAISCRCGSFLPPEPEREAVPA